MSRKSGRNIERNQRRQRQHQQGDGDGEANFWSKHIQQYDREGEDDHDETSAVIDDSQSSCQKQSMNEKNRSKQSSSMPPPPSFSSHASSATAAAAITTTTTTIKKLPTVAMLKEQAAALPTSSLSLDYYFGRGGKSNMRRQKTQALQLMRQLQQQYNNPLLKHKERRRFVEEKVYRVMIDRGGKFYKSTTGQDIEESATICSKDEAIDKLMQAMRDMKKFANPGPPKSLSLPPSSPQARQKQQLQQQQKKKTTTKSQPKLEPKPRKSSRQAQKLAQRQEPRLQPSQSSRASLSLDKLNEDVGDRNDDEDNDVDDLKVLVLLEKNEDGLTLASAIAKRKQTRTTANGKTAAKTVSTKNIFPPAPFSTIFSSIRPAPPLSPPPATSPARISKRTTTTAPVEARMYTKIRSISMVGGRKRMVISSSSTEDDDESDDGDDEFDSDQSDHSQGGDKGYTNMDILCGHTRPWMVRHPGNVRYQQRLQQYKHEYEAFRNRVGTKNGSGPKNISNNNVETLYDLGLAVVQELRSEGRRFLLRMSNQCTNYKKGSNPNKLTSKWVDMGDEKAVDKINRAARHLLSIGNESNSDDSGDDDDNSDDNQNSYTETNLSNKKRKSLYHMMPSDSNKVLSASSGTSTKKPRRASAARAMHIWKGNDTFRYQNHHNNKRQQSSSNDDDDVDNDDDRSGTDDNDNGQKLSSGRSKTVDEWMPATKWTVPFGRGGKNNKHPGHRCFHSFLHGRRTVYLELPVIDRRGFAKRLVRELIKMGAVFTDGIDGEVLTLRDAVSKTMQALRDGCSYCRATKKEKCVFRNDGTVCRDGCPLPREELSKAQAMASQLGAVNIMENMNANSKQEASLESQHLKKNNNNSSSRTIISPPSQRKHEPEDLLENVVYRTDFISKLLPLRIGGLTQKQRNRHERRLQLRRQEQHSKRQHLQQSSIADGRVLSTIKRRPVYPLYLDRSAAKYLPINLKRVGLKSGTLKPKSRPRIISAPLAVTKSHPCSLHPDESMVIPQHNLMSSGFHNRSSFKRSRHRSETSIRHIWGGKTESSSMTPTFGSYAKDAYASESDDDVAALRTKRRRKDRLTSSPKMVISPSRAALVAAGVTSSTLDSVVSSSLPNYSHQQFNPTKVGHAQEFKISRRVADATAGRRDLLTVVTPSPQPALKINVGTTSTV